MNHSSETPLSPQEAIAALQWLAEAGVDDTIGECPADWFSFGALPQPPAPVPINAAAAITPDAKPAPAAVEATPLYASQGTAALIAAARAAADACTTLAELQAAVAAFEGCALKKLATHTVFADGNADAGLMIIGEAPNEDDDREGKPFCGINGKLLDKMFGAIGLTRQAFYATNAVFWRPPGNRSATADELSICAPFVEKHIQLVNPKHLVLLGGMVAPSMLNSSEGPIRLRSRSHQYTNGYLAAPIPAYVIFPPSHLIRQPSHKGLAWRDLLTLKAAIEA